MRRPGGAVAPAMNPATGFLQFFWIHSAASSSAEPPISPIMMMPCVSGSSLNILMTSRCDVPLTGSPPMPTQVDWPDAAAGQLPDRFVGQRAAAGDDADVALFVNVTGRDADAAAAVRILALAGRDDAGTIRADEPRLVSPCMACLTLTMSLTGMPSVMQTTKSSPASARFQNGVGGEGRRDENGGDRRAGLADRVGDGVKDRNFFGRRARKPGRPCRA